MKKFLSLLLLISFISLPACADVYVNGYYRKDGTYVQPHYRSNPDGNPYNNYSTRGNVNPYTGQRGTVDPYRHQNNYGNSYGNHNNYGNNNYYGY